LAAPYITVAAAAQVFSAAAQLSSAAQLVARNTRRRLSLLSVAKRFAILKMGGWGVGVA